MEAVAARTAATTAARTAAAAPPAAVGPIGGGTCKLTHAHRPPHTATTAPHNNHTEPVRHELPYNVTSISTATSIRP